MPKSHGDVAADPAHWFKHVAARHMIGCGCRNIEESKREVALLDAEFSFIGKLCLSIFH
jgi:hypothetical protein